MEIILLTCVTVEHLYLHRPIFAKRAKDRRGHLVPLQVHACNGLALQVGYSILAKDAHGKR